METSPDSTPFPASTHLSFWRDGLRPQMWWFVPTLLLLSVTIGYAVWMDYRRLHDQATALAFSEAQNTANTVIAFRHWASRYGGVFVPSDQEAVPNAYLDEELQTVRTSDGKVLTRVNPAYMVRLVNSATREGDSLIGRLVSTHPSNPSNQADPWEEEALNRIARDHSEEPFAAAVTNNEGLQQLRLIHPLYIKESCMTCHERMGYELGDLRGGLSLEVPLEPYLATARAQFQGDLFLHVLFSLVGLCALGGIAWTRGVNRLTRRRRELEHQWLGLTARSSSNFVAIADARGEITWVNPALRRKLDKLGEEKPPRRLPLLLASGAENHTARIALRQALHEGRAADFPALLQLSDTYTCWTQVNLAAVPHNDRGEAQGFILIATDTQALREAEARALADRSRLLGVIDAIPHAIFAKDAEGRFTLCNDAFSDLLDQPRQRLLGHTLDELVGADHPLTTRFAEIDAALLGERGGQRIFHELMLWPGHGELPVQIHQAHLLGDSGDVRGLVGTIIDLSDYRRIQDELAERDRAIAEITSLVPGAVYQFRRETDGRMHVAYSSREITKLFDLDGDLDPSLESFVERIHEDDRGRFVQSIKTSAEELTFWSQEFRIRNRKGDIRWLQAQSIPMEAKQPGVILWNGFCMDITDRREAEEAVQLARREAEMASRTKSNFLNLMSHELRTPLNPILGWCDFLRADAESLPAEMQEAVTVIAEASEHMLELVNSILEYARLDRGGQTIERRRCPVAPVLESVYRSYQPRAANKGLTLHFNNRLPRGANIVSNPTVLRTILDHLLDNALKFTHDGDIRIEAYVINDRSGEPPSLRLDISDSGVGIPPERLAHIWDPFEQADTSSTRRYAGVGLGLTVCRDLVRLLGGTITAASTPGDGATFSLTLPWIFWRIDGATESAPPASETPEPAHASTSKTTELSGMRLLLVEDDMTNRVTFQRMLVALGIYPQTAEDGNRALELATTKSFDVILMDIQIPGLDGINVTEQIRANTALTQPYIIACSAYASNENREACLEAGADAFVAKPVRLARLQEALALAAEGRRAGGSHRPSAVSAPRD